MTVPMFKPQDIFQGQCQYCVYKAVAQTFEGCCEDLISHLQTTHLDELHEIQAHALNRAVVQAISCVA